MSFLESKYEFQLIMDSRNRCVTERTQHHTVHDPAKICTQKIRLQHFMIDRTFYVVGLQNFFHEYE